MASTVGEITAAINAAIEGGFRGQLLARGQARSMIWRDGLLSDDAPDFSTLLTYDLESYGYSLLNLSIRLLQRGGDAAIARSGFENAASALESAVAKGDANDSSRSFHLLMAASAYHLGRFSARAYSLIAPSLAEANISDAERCLSLLMIRNIDQLENIIVQWHEAGSGSDDHLMKVLEELDGAPDGEEQLNDDGTPKLLDALQTAITDNYMGAISTFLLALDRGDNKLVDEAIALLNVGLEAAAEFNFIPLWWSHRITIFLIGDLWQSSFYVNLPFAPAGQAGTEEWKGLRRLFIALLYKRKKSEIELWPSQLSAAARVVNLDDDLVVSLPTSAGKTRIAELAILRCLSSGRRVVFVTPLRALSAQTEVTLQKTFHPLGKTISSLYGSIGTSDFEEDALRDKHIVVSTPEKLDFALRNDPSLLDDVGLIVLDEGHMIGEGEREVRYEAQIQRLLRRSDAASRRIVCLSAILPEGHELDDFVNWLTQDKPEGAVKSDWRPTRLRFGEIVRNGDDWRLNLRVGDERPWVQKFIESKKPPVGKRKKLFPADQRELCLAAAWKLVQDGQSVLIFCTLRASVEPFAEAIVDINKRGALPSVLSCDEKELATAMAIGKEWLGENSDLLKCLKLGVAIHHGALPTPFRKEVERLLRDNVLKITISSPTLAQGLNLSASALIFYSVTRFGDPIEIHEFKNVIGRAGRAYVDVEGLILYPMFDEEAKRRGHWTGLISNEAGRGMESGLVRLVITLLLRMREKLGGQTSLLMEYVVNNASVWEFPFVPGEKADRVENERRRWTTFMASLDTAVLSLVGEDDIPVADLAARLDDVLSSSLWARTLARKTEGFQLVVKTALKARASYIWNHSTAVGRKGYFLAGVGLDTGRNLDTIAQRAMELLVNANGAVLNNDAPAAVAAYTQLAELIFAVTPFTPDKQPSNWREVLKAWLLGEPLASVAAGNEAEVLQFVEGGLIYRLPWGMEAIRVRGLSVGDYQTDELGLTFSDYELGVALPALETGTLNRSAALLIRTGFSSRLAAIALVQQTKATFETGRELQNWLATPEIESLSLQPNWPTPETAAQWKVFRTSFAVVKSKVWTHQTYKVSVDSQTPNSIVANQPLRIRSADGAHLLDAQYQKVGKLAHPLQPGWTGLLLVTSGEQSPTINLEYFGPEDLFQLAN